MAIKYYSGINISGSIVPSADSTFNLGGPAFYFSNVYADTYYGDGSNLTGLTVDEATTANTALALSVTVKNISGGSLSKGTVVHAAPSANPPSGNVIEVIAADYDTASSMPGLGVLNETLANNAEGEAIMFGAVSGIDTSSFIVGSELYVGNNGAFTVAKPTTAGQLIQKIGVVIKSNASNGLIKVFGAGRTNDVPLPLYIDNTNQRVGIGTATPAAKLDVSGDIYVRNGAALYTDVLAGFTSGVITLNSNTNFIVPSGNVGIGTTSPNSKTQISGDSTAPNLGSTTPTDVSLIISNSDINYGTMFATYSSGIGALQQRRTNNATYYDFLIQPHGGRVGIGTTSPSEKLDVAGTIRSNAYEGKVKINSTAANGKQYEFISIDTGNLGLYDGTAYRLWVAGNGNIGIGTTSPIGKLSIKGSGSTNATNALFLENSSSAYLIAVRDDGETVISGNVGIGTTSPLVKLHVGSTGTNAYSSTITKGSNMKGIMTTLSNNADDMVGIYFATGTTTEGTHWSGITGSRSDNAIHWGTQLNFYTHNNDVANLNDATQKMVIKGDGKVGIGTTAPARTLQVHKASATSSAIKISNSTTGATINDGFDLVVDSVGNAYLAQKEALPLIFLTSDTERMRIDSSGTTHIKTTKAYGSQTAGLRVQTTPTGTNYADGAWQTIVFGDETVANSYLGQLSVVQENASASTASTMRFYTNSGGGNGATQEKMRISANGEVSIGTSTALLTSGSRGNLTINGSAESILALGIGGTWKSYYFVNSSATYLASSSGTPLIFEAGGTEKMRISSSGDVTIRDGKKLILNRPDNAIDSELSTNSAGTLILNSRNGEGFDFQNAGIGAMRINSSGNVGIGTTTPLLTNAGRGNITVNGSADSILTLGVAGAAKAWFYTTASNTYLSGSSTLIFETGGVSNRLNIESDGMVTINKGAVGAKKFRVYYDMDVYNTVNFTSAAWGREGFIQSTGGNGVRIGNDTGAVYWDFNGSNGYFYAFNWIKIGGGAGIFSDTNSAHFYPNTYSNYGTWRIDGDRGNYSGILVNDVSAMPHIMYDNSGNGGLYNQGNGRWSVYYAVGNDCVAIGGSATVSGYKARVNGSIYVDSNVYAETQVQASTATMGDLGSYARFGSNSSSRGIVLSRDGTNYDFYVTAGGNEVVNQGLADGNGRRFPIVGGGNYTTSTSSVTGAIKISLPTSRYKSNTMMTFKVVIYEYNTGHTYEFRISGYNYSDAGATWYNESAINLTDNGKNLNVRFGHDGTKNIVWIGETNTVWSYPQVYVEDFTAGYSGYNLDGWATGWDVGFTTSFDSVSRNIATARIGKNSIIDSLTVNNTVGIGTSTTSSSYKAYVGGSLYATGDIVAYSDRRVKENIINIDSALDKVKALQGVYYNRINDKDKVREIGFIAQDVHDAVPELASYAEDVDEWGVKYSKVTGLHNEAIKELAQELDKKDEEIANLQAQIDELKQLILNK